MSLEKKLKEINAWQNRVDEAIINIHSLHQKTIGAFIKEIDTLTKELDTMRARILSLEAKT